MVLACADDPGERIIVAHPAAVPPLEAIIAHCRKQMTAYKVPRRITWLDELPKSGVGKILRRELRTL